MAKIQFFLKDHKQCLGVGHVVGPFHFFKSEHFEVVFVNFTNHLGALELLLGYFLRLRFIFRCTADCTHLIIIMAVMITFTGFAFIFFMSVIMAVIVLFFVVFVIMFMRVLI